MASVSFKFAITEYRISYAFVIFQREGQSGDTVLLLHRLFEYLLCRIFCHLQECHLSFLLHFPNSFSIFRICIADVEFDLSPKLLGGGMQPTRKIFLALAAAALKGSKNCLTYNAFIQIILHF